ncbi:hypothetical protein QNH28_02535 [Paenibacillus sp. G2S3]|uniref:hypothetical protein n=1 Tax=Paenibacillus sp. G2S3 TaxID=3047872 RepID=UPI0024C1E1B4|nr:hypothetical protein [Paenibacillus sp. G2S3]WHY22183.1 hypothetical protein QNH28_02535 [Paenibacillus sp. G2S3]
MLRLFPTVLKGKHVALPFVSMLRGRSVAVNFAEARPAIGDGESFGKGPLAVRCEPGALRVSRRWRRLARSATPILQRHAVATRKPYPCITKKQQETGL